MRTLLSVLISLVLLSACSYQNDSYQNDSYQNDCYQNDRYSSGYGRQSTYNYDVNEYRYYYPYGRADYPRERVYIVQPYQSCQGYDYRGYCYRSQDDYRRAMDYDRGRGYDDRWYQQRQSYCSQHDCRRDRDAKDRPRNHDDYRHYRQESEQRSNESRREHDQQEGNRHDNDNDRHHRRESQSPTGNPVAPPANRLADGKPLDRRPRARRAAVDDAAVGLPGRGHPRLDQIAAVRL